MTTSRWLLVAAVGTTLVLWASAFVAIRHLAGVFSPGALSLGRLVVGSACLAPLALSRRVVRPTRRELAAIVAIGALWFGVYNIALNEGEHRVDAGTAVMLIQVSPILIAVLATLFLGEPFTRGLAAGLALAFAGVALIAFTTTQEQHSDTLGVALCLLSALVYSVSLILQKPVVARIPAAQVTWLACTIGAVLCLPFVGQLVRETGQASAASIWWLAYLGVFPTAIAFTTYAYALRHMDAGRLGVTTYLVPPITILLSALLLAETPPSLAYAGGALALVGVAVARRRQQRPAPAAQPSPATSP
ncbi:MAG: DMT family transporter [Nocardioides sp.]